MSKTDYSYRVTGHQRIISGKCHHLVERSDGCLFYLDDVFLSILEHRSNPLQLDALTKLGIASDEAKDVQSILQMAGLATRPEKNGTEN